MVLRRKSAVGKEGEASTAVILTINGTLSVASVWFNLVPQKEEANEI
jgi:hypothetical protein